MWGFEVGVLYWASLYSKDYGIVGSILGNSGKLPYEAASKLLCSLLVSELGRPLSSVLGIFS